MVQSLGNLNGSEDPDVLRICQVSSCFIPSSGGVETFIYNLSKSLVQNGHQVKVITSSRGKPPSYYHEQVDGIDVVRYPEKHFFLETPILYPIALRVMKEDYDILHVHGIVPGLTELAALIGRLKRKPVLITYHCDAENNSKYISRAINIGYNFLLKYGLPIMADKIVATTSSYAETSVGLSRARDKLTIIPCGVGEEYLQYGATRADVGVLGNHHRLLFVGKLHKYKGVKDLLKALNIVKGEIPEVQLKIIGDGKERERLEALAHNLGLDSNVKFLCRLPPRELLEAFMKSDVVVLPSINSRREALGIVILEAMAMGKPVIASKIPGPESMIEDGNDGLLVPPQSHGELAEAIIHLLKNERLCLAMGQNGKQKARGFSYDLIAREYERLYSEMLGAEQLQSNVSVVPVLQVRQK